MNDEPRPLTLTAACDYVREKYGRGVTVQTMRKWISKGCRGVLLSGSMCGGRWTTTTEAVDEFVEGCTDRSGVLPKPTAAQVDREHEQAMKELMEHGIYGREKPRGGDRKVEGD